jgi:hypothetical protein
VFKLRKRPYFLYSTTNRLEGFQVKSTQQTRGRNLRAFNSDALSKPSARATIKRKSVELDTWLLRLSHVSQFGLFLFTIGTIYFTVIPLYQKALLEESIAKKEIELKEATAQLNSKEDALLRAKTELDVKVSALQSVKKSLLQAELKTYTQTRGYELSAFVFKAGAECTGLLKPIQPFSLSNVPARKEVFQEMLAFDMNLCLKDILQKSRLNQMLQAQDSKYFYSEFQAALKLLNQKRSEATSKIENMELLAQQDPRILKPAETSEAEIQTLIARSRASTDAAKDDRQEQFNRGVLRTKNALARDYENAVRNQMLKFRELDWPLK